MDCCFGLIMSGYIADLLLLLLVVGGFATGGQASIITGLRVKLVNNKKQF